MAIYSGLHPEPKSAEQLAKEAKVERLSNALQTAMDDAGMNDGSEADPPYDESDRP